MGVAVNLTRRYGRAPKGQRVVCAVPSEHEEKVSVIGALGVAGIRSALSLEGAVDGDVFQEFVEKMLAPTLKEGDVVVMDNVPFHKMKRIEELLTEAKAKVMFLPPYSPDYSPIENFWSKVKGVLRSLEARSKRSLEKALSKAFASITQEDIQGWFTHCGYQSAFI